MDSFLHIYMISSRIACLGYWSGVGAMWTTALSSCDSSSPFLSLSLSNGDGRGGDADDGGVLGAGTVARSWW